MKVLFGLIFFLNFSLSAQDFKNITLLDQWKDDQIVTSSSLVRYNDCWGFVFQEKEYAVAGSTEGTHIFEITNDNRFKNKGFVQGKFSSAQVVHRDFKTYGNYLYAVCDEGNSSLQIIDLSYLPDSVHLVSSVSNEIGRAHNLWIDETNQLLYAFKVTPIISDQPQTPFAMRVFSLTDPTNPLLLYSGPTDIAEVHDGYVRDQIAYLNCGVDGLRRYDFTLPSAPVFLQNIPFYQDQGYNHQGWLNPKGDVYIFADETNGKRLKKCSVNGNGDVSIQSLFGIGLSEGSIPHNVMLDDHFAYVAYYNFGLRIFDYTKTPVEQVAYFDTYPDNQTFQMNGAWGIYSLLPSKRILVSDRTYGLFLLDFDREKFINRTEDLIQVYPNPVQSGENLTFFLNASFKGAIQYQITDLAGRKVVSGETENFNYNEVPLSVEVGRYTLTLRYEKNLEQVEKQIPIVVY
jgi:choice-of-anchor B domain-containing protein